MLQWVGMSVLALVILSSAASIFINWHVEEKWPPIGDFAEIDGTKIHYVDVSAGEGADLPPIIFVHGSNGNLRDQMSPLRPLFEGRARMVFLDRPGHGYSSRKHISFSDPSLQAHVIAGLMDKLGIEKAIISGHSLGASITVAFGVHHPDKTLGLLFLAPATHPWPSGVDWYYKLAKQPFAGPFFSYVFAPVIGWKKYIGGVTAVFAPDPLPASYEDVSGTRIALRGRQFFNNSLDVANLNENVMKLSPRYREIKVPTVVITGDSDDIVMAEIHSAGLVHDIEGAELITIAGMGHKPDYVAHNEIVAAIERIAKQSK